jgi:hypothetical protein
MPVTTSPVSTEGTIAPMNFISRADAGAKWRAMMIAGNARHARLNPNAYDWTRLRNYEMEMDLAEEFGGEWCVTDWCPFNGRFCKVHDYIPWPHPPMSDEGQHPPHTQIPWREWDPSMTTKIEGRPSMLPRDQW